MREGADQPRSLGRRLCRRPRRSGNLTDPRGQALVEFALVAPVMLLLLLVAVDFGRLFFSYVAVNNAAREATFHAAAHASDSSFDQAAYEAAVTQAALRELAGQGQGGEGALTVSVPSCIDAASGTPVACALAADFAAGIGNQVSVSVSRPFTFITPLIGDLFGGQVMLAASATAPVLNRLDVSVLAGPSQSPTSTPTPTPTPEPTASPTPEPTLPPGETPTPSPEPTPTPSPTPPPTCNVPDFKNGFWNNTGGVPALQVWHDQAGFTGTLTNLAGDDKIKSQSLTKDTVVLCSSSMTVDDR